MRQPLTPRWSSTTHSSQTWMAPTSKCLHLRMTEATGSKNSPWEAEVERSIPLRGRTCTFQKGNGKTQADGLGPCGYCSQCSTGSTVCYPTYGRGDVLLALCLSYCNRCYLQAGTHFDLGRRMEGRRPWDGGEFRAVMFFAHGMVPMCWTEKSERGSHDTDVKGHTLTV